MESMPRNETIVILGLKNTSWSNVVLSQDYLPSEEQFLDEVKVDIKNSGFTPAFLLQGQIH